MNAKKTQILFVAVLLFVVTASILLIINFNTFKSLSKITKIDNKIAELNYCAVDDDCVPIPDVDGVTICNIYYMSFVNKNELSRLLPYIQGDISRGCEEHLGSCNGNVGVCADGVCHPKCK